jgi:uncharacterized protein (TIGR02611 family)
MQSTHDSSKPKPVRPKSWLKKILVAVAGGTLLVAGVVMLVLPGPAIVVIPAGLAILAIEFVWARRWLSWLRQRFKAISSGKKHRKPSRRTALKIPPRTQPREI